MEKEYLVKMEAWITASSLEEAEMKYESGDYYIDGHDIYEYDENGWEVEAV